MLIVNAPHPRLLPSPIRVATGLIFSIPGEATDRTRASSGFSYALTLYRPSKVAKSGVKGY